MSEQDRPDPLWKVFGWDDRFMAPEAKAARAEIIRCNQAKMEESLKAFSGFDKLIVALDFIDQMNRESDLKGELVMMWIRAVKARRDNNDIPF